MFGLVGLCLLVKKSNIPDCGVNACACEMKNHNFVPLNYPHTPIYLVVKWMPVLVRWKVTILCIWIILTLRYTWFWSECLCWWDKKSQFCSSELSLHSNIPGFEVNACAGEIKNHNFVHLNYPHTPIYLVVKWMPVRWKITILFIWIILTIQYTITNLLSVHTLTIPEKNGF